MTRLVDTSVWSVAFRRDGNSNDSAVLALRAALAGGESIVTTGLIFQELLQGFAGPRARTEIVERFAALPLIILDRRDCIDAAAIRNRCRRSDVQIGTIDALLAELCIRHDLTLLTTDGDIALAAKYSSLRVWRTAK